MDPVYYHLDWKIIADDKSPHKDMDDV